MLSSAHTVKAIGLKALIPLAFPAEFTQADESLVLTLLLPAWKFSI
jgi:hypothetical protein